MYKFITGFLFASPILLYGISYDAALPESFNGLTADVDSDNTDGASDAAVVTVYNDIPLFGEVLAVNLIKHADGATFLAEEPTAGYAATEFGTIALNGDLSNPNAGISEKYGLAVDYALNKNNGAFLSIEMVANGFELNKASLLPSTTTAGEVVGGDLTLLDDVTIQTPPLVIANASIETTTKYIGNRIPANDADVDTNGIADGLENTVVDGTATEFIQLVGDETSNYADFDDSASDKSLKFIVTMIAN